MAYVLIGSKLGPTEPFDQSRLRKILEQVLEHADPYLRQVDYFLE